MTPCEERGWKVGQVFEGLNTPILYVLIKDREALPSFLILTGALKGANSSPSVECLKRIYPPELSKDVTVTCEGHEITISRESAIKLGLCK